MKLKIKSIPHKKQRVGEVGDYWEKRGETTFVVSEMYEQFMQAVILHELIEYFLVKNRGIKLKDIDNFDRKFYNDKRNKGEAGMSSKAPYRTEHLFATKIEAMFIKELGISWQDYSEFINNL